MTISDLPALLITFTKKVFEWFNTNKKQNNNKPITQKQNTSLTDNSITNNISFNNCNFNSPPKKIIDSLNKSKILQN